MRMDEKDEMILEMLRKNSRTPNVEIAKAVDLTEGAVRRRIDNLKKSGTIARFTIDTKGASSYAIVMVKATKDSKQMMGDIRALGITKDAYEISGDYDGCLILEGNTIEEIDKKIDALRQQKSVAGTKTFMSFGRW